VKAYRERLLRKGDYVYGSFVKPEQVDGYINAVNPGDRTDLIGRFPFSVQNLEEALRFAQMGAQVWRRWGLMDRAAAVRRFREQVVNAQEALARLLTRENGKSLWEARQEVASTIRAIDLYLDDGLGLVAPRLIEDISARTDYLPRGVVGIVAPYNLPVLLGASLAAASILGGNAVVMKPSKFTPGTGQALAELWDKCKIPRGVFNLVQGSGGVIGQRLVSHPALDAFLFAGSYESAREIRAATADRPELPALYQCGGKGIAIVLDDAEVDRAVYEVIVGACLTCGQRHNSTARVIVTRAVHDRFVAELLRRIRRLTIGWGLDADTFMGPLISENLRTRFRRFGRTLVQRGHTALLEADVADVPGWRGNYVHPGVYAMDWQRKDPSLTEEPPGPLLMIYRVEDWEEAVELHNRAAFRLCASLFTRPDNPALPEVKDTLRTGALNLNRGTIGTSLRLPSMGLGRSSNGVAAGMELMRVVTYPRSSLVEARPFDPANLVPGVNWDVEDTDVDVTGSLELAVD
jgi:acyl-CoA reductase-like NAD-dependent aldehyde dehydrogenase